MFDTLGFLWLHHDGPPYLLYHLEKLVDGRTGLRSITTTTTTLSEVTIGINQSFVMEPTTAAVCDGNFKSKNITVHGNAAIVMPTGAKLVYIAEQRKALELMVIVEEKCPIAQRDGYKCLKGHKASHSSLTYQARRFC